MLDAYLNPSLPESGLIGLLRRGSSTLSPRLGTHSPLRLHSEVWKLLNAALFTSTVEDQCPRPLGVLLLTISHILLANAPPSQLVTASVITQTMAQLLSFTTTSPSAFKEAVGKLDTSTRELLEHSVRRAVCGTANAAAQSAAKPQISLRAFYSSVYLFWIAFGKGYH
ncbi:hypothetical protein BDZ97DRAFT_1914290 [Flammula alnicola]|nr:hypothetical protein BDZ97DRAFT_1914290 [Flammula alnicola]